MDQRRHRCHRHRRQPHTARHILRGRRARSQWPSAIRHSHKRQSATTDSALRCRHRHISSTPSTSSRTFPSSVSAVATPSGCRSTSACLHIRIRRWHQAVAHATLVEGTTHGSTSSQMPSASASASHGPPHSPRASSWLPSQSQSPSAMPSPPQTPHSSRTFPSQSQSPSGCLHIRIRRWHQGRCTRHTRRGRLRMDQRRHRCHRHRRQPHTARHILRGRRVGFRHSRNRLLRCRHRHKRHTVEDVSVAVAVSFRDVCTSAFVDAHALVEGAYAWINVVTDAITSPHSRASRVTVTIAIAMRSPPQRRRSRRCHPHS